MTPLPDMQQVIAVAREISAQPGTVVLVIDYANGEGCAWCDCPTGAAASHRQARRTCPGCPNVADSVVRVVQESEDRSAIPACSRHLAETARTIALLAAQPV